MTLFETLKDRCRPEWEAYIRHEFVEKLGEGTLPIDVFRDYLIQDFHFLVQFARANALAAFKSRTLADITAAHQATGAIIAETALHLRLTERWGIPRAELEAAAEKQATVAYTRYVLDAGMSGDLLDLHVALAPCTIGYAEIGALVQPRLADHRDVSGSGGGVTEHPYAEWIAEYSGAEFTAASAAAIAQLDQLAAGGLSERRLDELTGVFSTATRLEADFWQQALDSVA
ncbi:MULTISPECIES: TenA family protein [unclassified Dietzia]|uniref:TenA family protein n=1 Tax=unclassified Dietzia TaxID=2617939 RepID=UPI0015FD99EE|nr:MULTISPECIES: TenA family protein [unclassified Dietzia]MBB1025817.1 TenA family protein [Dietzia sp. DQ12-76]MBB1028763.1 TenA family protein [Dietzia sp. DQ11-38-2]